MHTLRPRAAGAFLLSMAAAVAAGGWGCSSGAPGDESRSESAAVTSPDASADAPTGTDAAALPSPYSSCSASLNTKFAAQLLSFSTSLPCAGDAGACSTAAMTLHATASSAAGGSLATWTIDQGQQLVLMASAKTANGETTTTIQFGTMFQGIQSAQVVRDGAVLSGTVDGRALLPMDPSKPPVHVAFADGGPPPVVSVSSDIQSAIHALLQTTGADAKVLCHLPGTTSILTGAVSALEGSLSPVALPVQPPASAPPNGSSSGTIPTDPVAGVPSDSDGTNQNNFLDWETPDCKSCQEWCDAQYLFTLWFAWWDWAVCSAGCFNPFQGCAEQVCLEWGFGTCDRDMACCGSGCCGTDQVCGNVQQGACCPKDHPVGCGDETGVWCYPAGSQCCGTLEMACGPGTVCANVTALSATCCAPDHLSSQGECCDQPACNGACCSGTCTNGVCCGAGETVCNGQCCGGACVGGVCCDGVNQTVCGGSCCTGSCCGGSCCPQGQTCTSTGVCCPAGQPACGSACCAANATCTNAATSTCQATSNGNPVLQFWSPSTGTGSAGDTQCGSNPCETELWGYSFYLRGTGFAPGPVTITLSDSGSVVGATFSPAPSADSTGTLVTKVSPTGSGSQVVTITAKDSSGRSATVYGSFTQLH